jgi:hypothetical protein
MALSRHLFSPGNAQRLAMALALVVSICSHCIHAEFHKSPAETADALDSQDFALSDRNALGDDDNYPLWKDPLFREKSGRQFADIVEANEASSSSFPLSSSSSASAFDFFTDSSQETSTSGFSSYSESDPSWSLASSYSSEERPAPYKRIQYQRNWCPGKALLRILEDAQLPIYQWVAQSATCAQFSRNYGDISVAAFQAGFTAGGESLCSSGPAITPQYCMFRSFTINEPVYQNYRAPDTGDGFTNYALACTTLYMEDGYVVSVCITAPVSRLPDVC